MPVNSTMPRRVAGPLPMRRATGSAWERVGSAFTLMSLASRPVFSVHNQPWVANSRPLAFQ
jgi:hypothetical protein